MISTIRNTTRMHSQLRDVGLLVALSLGLAGTGLAQDRTAAEVCNEVDGTDETSQTSSEPVQVEELRRRVEILAAEVEKLRSGEPDKIDLPEERRRALGLAPSAAATYRRASQGVSLAGYGEMLLENFAGVDESGAGSPPTTRLDFLRAILYAGYRFDDKFLFNLELEVEHASEIFVEFAYIDYLVNDNLSVRAGLLLLPLGLVNEFHEPNVFIGSRRPETEQRILPSTWSENGAGLLGNFGRINFRAYLVNGLNASRLYVGRSARRPPARVPGACRQRCGRGARGCYARLRASSPVLVFTMAAPARTPSSSMASASTSAPRSARCTDRPRFAASTSGCSMRGRV